MEGVNSYEPEIGKKLCVTKTTEVKEVKCGK